MDTLNTSKCSCLMSKTAADSLFQSVIHGEMLIVMALHL